MPDTGDDVKDTVLSGGDYPTQDLPGPMLVTVNRVFIEHLLNARRWFGLQGYSSEQRRVLSWSWKVRGKKQ